MHLEPVDAERVSQYKQKCKDVLFQNQLELDMEEDKKLRRTEGKEALIFGICGGMAKFFSLDVTIIRIIWAVLTFVGVGSPILIYLIMAFIIPKEGAVK